MLGCPSQSPTIAHWIKCDVLHVNMQGTATPPATVSSRGLGIEIRMIFAGARIGRCKFHTHPIDQTTTVYTIVRFDAIIIFSGVPSAPHTHLKLTRHQPTGAHPTHIQRKEKPRFTAGAFFCLSVVLRSLDEIQDETNGDAQEKEVHITPP